MSKPLVYIAGPYTHPDPVTNTRNAVSAGLDIYKATGCPVIIPHLSLLAHAMFPHDVNFWYDFDLEIVDHCDVLYRLPGASSGADLEVAHADENGILVFTSYTELYEYLDDWDLAYGDLK